MSNHTAQRVKAFAAVAVAGLLPLVWRYRRAALLVPLPRRLILPTLVKSLALRKLPNSGARRVDAFLWII